MLLRRVSCSVRRLAVRDLRSDSKAQSTVCSCVLPFWRLEKKKKEEECNGRINIQFFCHARLRLRSEWTRPAEWDRPLCGIVRWEPWLICRFSRGREFYLSIYPFSDKDPAAEAWLMEENTFTAWRPTSFFFSTSHGDFTPVTSCDTKDTVRKKTIHSIQFSHYCSYLPHIVLKQTNLAQFLQVVKLVNQ